jgi:hypothetical protein
VQGNFARARRVLVGCIGNGRLGFVFADMFSHPFRILRLESVCFRPFRVGPLSPVDLCVEIWKLRVVSVI